MGEPPQADPEGQRRDADEPDGGTWRGRGGGAERAEVGVGLEAVEGAGELAGGVGKSCGQDRADAPIPGIRGHPSHHL